MMKENSDNYESAAEVTEISPHGTPQNNTAGHEEGNSSSSAGSRRMSNPTQTLANFANNNPELQQFANATAAKINAIQKWTVNTYKNTKHLCMEQIGKIDKTVDKELEGRIDALRELRKSYREVLSTAHHFTNYLNLANNMQRSMANAFCELASKEAAIAEELNMESELFGLLAQNNVLLQRTLSHFLSSLQTLTDSAIEDTFLTIENHDQARLEFDVARQELKIAKEGSKNVGTIGVAEIIAEMEAKCTECKQKYEQLKEDVRAKLVLLEENRCKVMRKQIIGLQQAFATSFSANSQAVERANSDLTKMGIEANQHLMPSNSTTNSHQFPSFLEK